MTTAIICHFRIKLIQYCCVQRRFLERRSRIKQQRWWLKERGASSGVFRENRRRSPNGPGAAEPFFPIPISFYYQTSFSKGESDSEGHWENDTLTRARVIIELDFFKTEGRGVVQIWPLGAHSSCGQGAVAGARPRCSITGCTPSKAFFFSSRCNFRTPNRNKLATAAAILYS